MPRPGSEAVVGATGVLIALVGAAGSGFIVGFIVGAALF